jgi:hypothetical protein
VSAVLSWRMIVTSRGRVGSMCTWRSMSFAGAPSGPGLLRGRTTVSSEIESIVGDEIEQVLLALDEVIEARLGDSHLVGDIAHRRRVIALDAEELSCLLENLGAPLVELGRPFEFRRPPASYRRL